MRIIAILAVYNESDILPQTLRHLIAQGVDAYIMDHHSTSDTAAAIAPFLGRGVIGIERFPEDAGAPAEDAARYSWATILRRKETLAQTLQADWFIHHDADEFRESPWPELNLRDAVAKVDALGYNAIDFEVLDFPPTEDARANPDDVLNTFLYYERSAQWNRIQIRAWKRAGAPVNLASSGGHEACFPNRRVFPLRFLMRHYPIRSQAHGERKVQHERRPRFVPEERKRGWHIQYDTLGEAPRFVRRMDALTRYDPFLTRLALTFRHRGVEELETERNALELQNEELETERNALKLQNEELAESIESLRRHFDQSLGVQQGLQADRIALEARVEDIYRSWSWRLTAPARTVLRWLRRE
jgi:glycosyltransferase involved in cell wall biosynthesis